MRGYDYGLLCLTPLSRILQLSYIVAVSLFVEESHEHVKILKNRLTPRLYKCYYHSTVTNRWYVTTQCINTYEDI
jgi:hypothetical protein